MGSSHARSIQAVRKSSTYGRSGAANDRPLDGDTVFEIGSITKVFTALLLTEMVTRAKLRWMIPSRNIFPTT